MGDFWLTSDLEDSYRLWVSVKENALNTYNRFCLKEGVLDTIFGFGRYTPAISKGDFFKKL